MYIVYGPGVLVIQCRNVAGLSRECIFRRNVAKMVAAREDCHPR